ncbi:rod shape-determining protein MreD [Zwartia sp.]|uniref:rod shape-determining protein MreD n=1 Tax=Zwartia sp. TaxID=2978004 RepID=UPI00271657FB|nr:rod shape-determining protein MreD [Zwartia sp.]MDO9024763.1 rod shape-determining protein MreD [Zwartia sp.]
MKPRLKRPPMPMAHAVGPESLENTMGAGYVWATLLTVWILSLLPWRVWHAAPEVLLLVITFWSLHDSRRIGMVVAFLFGLTLDVHDVGPLGLQALMYTLTVYGAQAMQRRVLRFDLFQQALHLLPIFVGAKFVTVLIGSFLVSAWPGWSWLFSALLTVALWPLVGWLLLLPQHRLDDAESGST